MSNDLRHATYETIERLRSIFDKLGNGYLDYLCARGTRGKYVRFFAVPFVDRIFIGLF